MPGLRAFTPLVAIAGLMAMLWFPRAAHAAADDNIPGVTITSSPISGSLDYNNDYDDVYAVKLNAGQMLIASVTAATNTQFDLFLFPPGSSNLETDDDVATALTLGYPNKFNYIVPGGKGGTYYLDVYCEEGSGNYTLTYKIVTPGADDNVPGTSPAASPISGSLNQASDIDDVFKFNLSAGQVLYASITADSGTIFDLFVFPSSTTNVTADDSIAADFGDDYPYRLHYTVPAGKGGTYYLDAYCWRGSGNYTLTYKVVTGGADDVFPGKTPASATITDSLNVDSDYQDIYAVSVKAGQKLTYRLQGASGTDFDLYLFPPGTTDTAADGEVAKSATTSNPEIINYTATTAGTYYVVVSAYDGSGSYTLYTKNAARDWSFYE